MHKCLVGQFYNKVNELMTNRQFDFIHPVFVLRVNMALTILRVYLYVIAFKVRLKKDKAYFDSGC